MMEAVRRNPDPEELKDDALIRLGRDAFIQEAGAIEAVGLGLDADFARAVTFVAEPTVRYGDVIRALDALREIPKDATNPRVRHQLPHGGCYMKFDRKVRAFGFEEQRGESVRDTGCMYYHVTLAIGAS